MLPLLLLLQVAGAPASDSVKAVAARAVAPLADTAAARAAGFAPIFGPLITDRTPFQGEHWVSGVRFNASTSPEVALGEPAFVMFNRVGGTLRRVGAAYITRLPQGASSPVGLGGDRAAGWHTHQWCRIPGFPGLQLLDSAEDCRAEGGTVTPRQMHMVHVWTDVPNPEGVYGHDNPALPYLATGLAAPRPHDLHDAARVRAIRALALALGETYDARMPMARAVEMLNRDAALADSLKRRRAAIAAELPALKAADAKGDRAAYDRVAARMIAQWEGMARIYERMAPTPATLARLKREHQKALTVSHH